MVVDNDQEMRGAIADTLRDGGHDVMEAASGGCKTRLLCIRLGTGHSGAILVNLHTVRRASISGEHLG